jgi:hypothetical protein
MSEGIRLKSFFIFDKVSENFFNLISSPLVCGETTDFSIHQSPVFQTDININVENFEGKKLLFHHL